MEKIIRQKTTPLDKNVLWLDTSTEEATLKYFRVDKWIPVGSSFTDQQIEELQDKVDSLDKEVGTNKNDLSVLKAKQTVELEIGNTAEIKGKNIVKLKGIQSTDHLFFADIDYGYGPARWLPTTGGEAFITTSKGSVVVYTLSVDGAVTKSEERNLLNIDTDLFEVVATLPQVKDAKTSKLYCVKDTTSTDDKNKYIEYALVNDTEKGAYKWEIVGEFVAAPDLSVYAKKSDIGNVETFTFTLSDGTTVTKKIRVL